MATHGYLQLGNPPGQNTAVGFTALNTGPHNQAIGFGTLNNAFANNTGNVTISRTLSNNVARTLPNKSIEMITSDHPRDNKRVIETSRIYKKLFDRYESRNVANVGSVRRANECDFTIISSDGFEFPVHSAELSGSEYFGKMLGNGMRESVENRVTLCDVDSQVLDILLRYIYYEGVIDTVVGTTKSLYSPEFVADLLITLDKYCFPEYAKILMDKILDDIRVDNVCASVRLYYNKMIVNNCDYYVCIYRTLVKIVVEYFKAIREGVINADKLGKWESELPKDALLEIVKHSN